MFDLLGFFGDFAFSALIGGGAAAYCSLRSDTVGEYANKFGGYVMMGLDKGVPVVKEKTGELIEEAKKAFKS